MAQNSAFEVDPVLRLGEFAIRRRTGEGILGDGVSKASKCPVYTGVKAGPVTGSNELLYGMLNGKWVRISRKPKS